MRYLIRGGTSGTDSFSKTDINPLYARKMPICRNWFGIFIFTLLNLAQGCASRLENITLRVPEGTLLNRVNPLRAKIVVDLKELDRYSYCGHSALTGKKKRQWQDVEYVLGFFGTRVGEARKGYVSYVKKGIALGRRPELVGGGLIRSLGGWDEVKKMRLSGQDRIKSDQRILGESDFVSDVLSESEEEFSRKYRLKSLGYDFEKVVERVCILFQVEKDYITGRGRQKDRGRARDLLCYWTVVELGMPMVDLAREFDITPAAVSYAVQKWQRNGVTNWKPEVFEHLRSSPLSPPE
jgi:hypothetical protein